MNFDVVLDADRCIGKAGPPGLHCSGKAPSITTQLPPSTTRCEGKACWMDTSAYHFDSKHNGLFPIFLSKVIRRFSDDL